MGKKYWSPHKRRYVLRQVEGVDIIFDPVASALHLLTPLHSAVLEILCERENSALDTGDIVTSLQQNHDFDGEGTIAGTVSVALEHLLDATLIEQKMGSAAIAG